MLELQIEQMVFYLIKQKRMVHRKKFSQENTQPTNLHRRAGNYDEAGLRMKESSFNLRDSYLSTKDTETIGILGPRARK